MVLSALTKGLPPMELDPLSMEFLQSCAKDLAVRLSNENTEKEKEILTNWSIEQAKVCRSYGKKASSGRRWRHFKVTYIHGVSQDSAISNIVNNPDVNTLGVPQNLLSIRDD